MMEYSKKVLEHFKKPKHVGEIKNPSGVGNVGNIRCGDTMKLFIKVEDGIIKDVKFKTFGCAAAIASSDMLCDIIIGKTIEKAKNLKKDDIVKELGNLPPQKLHCSVLAIDALKKAIEDYEKRKNSQKMNRSPYKFLWGNHQSNLTIQMNFNCFIKFSDIVWNQVKNIMEISRDNNISCFHSRLDLENDVERGKLYFDRALVRKFVSDLEKRYDEHRVFFNSLKQIDFSKLSDERLFEYFLRAADNWSHTMGFFRATQAEGTYYITKELKKYFLEEEASILMIPQKLDIANKEILDWRGLIKKPYSREILIEHAEKYPWLVAGHVTYDDVIETLTQRYDYNKEHLFKDTIKEKKELKEKQKKIISKAPKLKSIVELSQRLALLRMKIKSCWAGTEFYIIPIYKEIAKRTNEDIYDIHKYYLIDEIKQLLGSITLSKEEKEKRKRCFVGLWKEGKAVYKSGEEAEKLAKKELKELYEIKETDEIRGTTANLGKARGIARILRSNDVQQAREFRKNFEKGQILITQMTQPGIMDIAMRASAIVTDEGGLLSHAAIISREFKIPCIVGTEKATKVFKDGDLIEVDAHKGIVKKVSKQ